MNVSDVVLFGFIATLVQSTLMAASQGLGISRISIPFILGTALTGNRDRAMVWGFFLHVLLGWILAGLYAAIFEQVAMANVWLGSLLGVGHGLFLYVVVMPMLPSFHPRMASVHVGPDPTRALEPPGFFALNYGRFTPAVGIAAHLVYGAILGATYHLAR